MNDGAGALLIIVYLAVVALMIVSEWIVFAKAGQPGWAVLIPIYNIYVFLKIAGKPGWWLLIIFLVPIANIVFMIMALVSFVRNFGKSGGFAVGMIFLPIIFWPILAFGDARYEPVSGDMSYAAA